MGKSLLLLLAILLGDSCFGQGQEHLIYGQIVDSLGNPIGNASVSIIVEATGEGLYFTQTNEKGLYSFSILDQKFPKDGIAIKVSAIGYVKRIKKINTLPAKIDFLLTTDIQQLPEITIKDEQPRIRRKGDTLNYKVNDFSNENDRVIGDVLKKLPGIEVTEEGIIKYNGKPINNFYIEGDNLLDDRYNIASKSIPARVVDKIQVIENNQNIKMLDGIVNSDRAAINITLKEQDKFNFINTGKAGAGVKDLYLLELNNMAFKSKFKAINSLKTNNAGSDLQLEIQSLNPLGANASNNDQSIQILSLSPNKPFDIPSRRTLFNNAFLMHFNELFKVRNDLSLKINASYLRDKQTSDFVGQTKYFLPGRDTISFLENEKTVDQANKLFVQLNINKNSRTQYFNNSLSFISNWAAVNVATISNHQSIKQILNGSLVQFKNELNGVKLISGKNIIEYSSYISFHKNPQRFYINPGLHNEILNDSLSYKESIQFAKTPSFYTNNYVSWRKISNYLIQNYQVGASYQSQNLTTNLDLIQWDNTITSAQKIFTNRLHYHNIRLYINPEFRWEKDKNVIVLTTPLSFSSLSYRDVIQEMDTVRNFFYINPSLRWNRKVGRESGVFLFYNLNSKTGNIDQLYRGVVLLDYRNFNSNDGSIQQSQNHNVGAGINLKKSLKIFFYNFYINYGFRENNYTYYYQLENKLIRRVALPFKNDSRSFMLSSDISKYLFRLKTTVTFKFDFFQYLSSEFQNEIFFPITNTSYIYFVGIRPKIVQWANANYEVSFARFNGKSSNGGEKSKSEIDQFRHRIDIDLFPLKQWSNQIAW